MDSNLAPREADALQSAVFSSGEESVDNAYVDSDDESSVLPPPPDVEGSSISDHPLDDDPYGVSTQKSVLPVTTQPRETEPAAEPQKSLPAGSEQEINFVSMARTLPRPDGSGGSNRSDKSDSRFKTQINDRLTQALSRVDFAELRRSPDLVPLTQKYHVFRKQLRSLIAAIKAYRKTSEKMQEARSKLYKEFFMMSEDTPLFDYVGKSLASPEMHLIVSSGNLLPEADCVEPESGQRLEDDMRALSLASVHQLALVNQKKGSEEYDEFILAYALEWEEVITSRLDKEIKNVLQLRRKRLHYEKKVGGLRRRTNRITAKGNEVPAAVAERCQRNEQKLEKAFQFHERSASELCVLLEEAIENGWKFLYPLVKNALRFEVNRISRDEGSYGRLKSTLDAMKKISLSPTTSPANSEMNA